MEPMIIVALTYIVDFKDCAQHFRQADHEFLIMNWAGRPNIPAYS